MGEEYSCIITTIDSRCGLGARMLKSILQWEQLTVRSASVYTHFCIRSQFIRSLLINGQNISGTYTTNGKKPKEFSISKMFITANIHEIGSWFYSAVTHIYAVMKLFSYLVCAFSLASKIKGRIKILMTPCVYVTFMALHLQRKLRNY